jgi:hypothetical protein
MVTHQRSPKLASVAKLTRAITLAHLGIRMGLELWDIHQNYTPCANLKLGQQSDPFFVCVTIPKFTTDNPFDDLATTTEYPRGIS